MNDLLLLFLSLSLSGSLTALALILLRPVLRRFGKTWQYYIWLLVVLRLLVPFRFDVNIVGGLFQQAKTHFTAQYPPGNILTENEPPGLPARDTTDFQNNALQKSSAAPAFSFSWKNHLSGAVWLTTAMFFFLRKAYGYRQFVIAVRKKSEIITDGQLPATLYTVRTAMRIRKKISVCVNPLVRAPMITGILKPVIVLPDKAIPSSELPYIFRHELTHYRRLDFLYKWLVEIVVCLHWFNPLVYWVRKQINRDCEFACDEAVISGLGNAERHTYGDTLLNSIDRNYNGNRRVVSLSLSEDGRLIKERLCAIMQYKRKSKTRVFIAAVLTSVLLCGTVIAGAYPVTAAENTAGSGTFGEEASGRQPLPASVHPKESSAQTVVYNDVEIRRYDGEDGHPYIHNTQTNNTPQGIVGYKRGMLAFDKDGNPLKIDWWSIDTESDSAYFWLYEDDSAEIAAGDTDDVFGGWSLNLMGNDTAAADIAFVLYCNKEISFEDGTVWENPDFESWRSAYEGKKVDVDLLENNYPFEHQIPF